jgi:tetratricopeptide (TPR) repeat protein
VHALFVQQDYAHALQVHAQYEQPTADYWFDRALLQWKMHNITAAHQAIANAYTHDANYPAARLIELQLFFDEKRFDDITAALRAWLQADKTNALPVEALFLLRKEGMPAQPLQTMMHELIAQQGPCSLWLAALIDLAGTSSSVELDEQLNGCTRNTQAQQALRYKKAYQLLTAGNYNQLATYLDSLSSADLATSTFENLRAYFYAQTNNYLEQAHTLIEPLVRANPANAAYLDTYGFVYMRRGDAQKAKESFDKALAVEPGNSLVREHLSQL